MTPERRRELVQAFYDQLWNRFDRARIEALLERDLEFRGSLGQRVVGHKGFASYMEQIQSFAPDFHNRIDSLTVGDEGDPVAARQDPCEPPSRRGFRCEPLIRSLGRRIMLSLVRPSKSRIAEYLDACRDRDFNYATSGMLEPVPGDARFFC